MISEDKLGKKVLNLFHVNGSEMRAKEIYERGKAKGISHITIQRKLDMLAKNGSLKRRSAEHKEVYYSRQESVRLTQLIDDVTREVITSLNAIPSELSTLATFVSNEEKIAGKGITKNAEKLLDNLSRTKIDTVVMQKLIDGYFKVLKRNLPNQWKTKGFYVNLEGRIIPGELVDEKIKDSDITKWAYDNLNCEKS
jgi:Fe2+ or Zn2+ uptake regulation protein